LYNVLSCVITYQVLEIYLGTFLLASSESFSIRRTVLVTIHIRYRRQTDATL